MSKSKSNGSWGKVDGVAPPIPVAAEVGVFETAYRLPELTGSRRQIDWARNIRHQYLSPIFSGVMEAVREMDDPKPVYNALDALRDEQKATAWIDLRIHTKESLKHLVQL